MKKQRERDATRLRATLPANLPLPGSGGVSYPAYMLGTVRFRTVSMQVDQYTCVNIEGLQMDTTTLIRIAAVVLFVIVLVVLIQRNRKRGK